MRVVGFWHVYMTTSWYTIVLNQIRILLTSGLYDECEEIRIGCIGSEADKAFLKKYVVDVYPKLKIKYFSVNPLEYEFPTLRLIEDDDTRYVGFYFHTKGVTRPHESIISHWRHLMEETVLNQWREHRERVENGYDVSSMGYLMSPNHFSGNFWWFNRNYFNRCPRIDFLDKTNRYHAEQWVCMGNPTFYSIPHIEPSDAVFPIKYK